MLTRGAYFAFIFSPSSGPALTTVAEYAGSGTVIVRPFTAAAT